ncbi:PIN domain-containing protein [Mariniradius saccharolyticus]|uniref:PIN domain-containing protein n=1 Tax=Mariniradius saccharolyticus TaxID=1245591 RepID=UPI00058D2AB5
MSKIAVDTNVLLYFFLNTSETERRIKAAELISKEPVFNSQSLSELINVLTRRWKYSKESVIQVSTKFLEVCNYVPLTEESITLAYDICKNYDFQIFDAFVVSTAIESGCESLYTEDLHHGLIIDKKLTIINPFA